MSKKKGKFDLTKLVHDGFLKDGEKIYFVSNPSFFAFITKQPNHEYKIKTYEETTTTVHAFAQQCLGTESPDHASRWFRTEQNVTLYQVWQNAEEHDQAA
jgi:hypothetical protein